MSREALAVQSLHFQRSEGPVRVRKPVRKSPLRFIHILAVVFAVAALFFGITHLYGFLITWDHLAVRSSEVTCSDSAVEDLVRPMAARAAAGNILLLDAARVKAGLEACAWVKEAHVRKVFPSSLAVDIVPRQPEAILDAGKAYLLGRDNVPIEPARAEDANRLPIFHDDGLFVSDREARLRLAWACWDDLDAATRDRVARLDVSDPADVALSFRDDPVLLRLGSGQFAAKIAEYAAGRVRWAREFGRLEYVDFRFADRIYLKAAPEEGR
ncbi:MAG: FtsQ-type POTRA domain-containing protein [Candidatus Aminicenantes bacterium]|nr:FtsQ-type POTRA domain-containing protein [Candidatus Aminicenantes bacterium]